MIKMAKIYGSSYGWKMCILMGSKKLRMLRLLGGVRYALGKMLYILYSIYKEGKIWFLNFCLLCMMEEVSCCNILENHFEWDTLVICKAWGCDLCWRRRYEALKQRRSTIITGKYFWVWFSTSMQSMNMRFEG